MLKEKGKKKYIAIFVIKEKGSFGYVGSKNISATTTTVKFKKGTYHIDITKDTYSKGIKKYYLIDVAGSQLKIDDRKVKDKSLTLEATSYDPEVLDMVISKSIVSQLTANLSDNAIKMNILTLAIGGLIGGLLGYILAGVI